MMSMLLISIALISLPTRTWTFAHQGYHIKIQNFAFHEKIYVNDVFVPKTKQGFSFRDATHHIQLSNHQEIHIYMHIKGFDVICQASVQGQIIYHSHQKTPLNSTTKDVLIVADDQWYVAKQLLQEIHDSKHEQLMQAGKELEITLERIYSHIYKIKNALQNYSVLGEHQESQEDSLPTEDDSIQQLLQKYQEQRIEILDMIKKLHLYMIQETDQDVEIPSNIKTLIAELQIHQDIDAYLDTYKHKSSSISMKKDL